MTLKEVPDWNDWRLVSVVIVYNDSTGYFCFYFYILSYMQPLNLICVN